MKQANDLRQLLRQIDHKSYPAYKDTRGSYRFPGYILNIDHVQGDPFASPSKVSIAVAGKEAGFPADTYDEPHKRIALQDHILRLFSRALSQYSFKARGSGKSGLIGVSRCGQEILERTACQMDPKNGDLLIRMEIGFPADGRRINSGELVKILFDFLPECIPQSLFYKRLDAKKIEQVKNLSEDQHYIRQQLKERNLTAFVADGTILPRESGVSARPMKNAVPFKSPDSLKVTLDLPHHGPLTGMGVPQGITLIVGGGYHGKSTLLKALELGVYDHIAGDGREYVATDDTAVKIRAEDGRSIKKADISMFINNLPNNRDTQAFSTEDASGSTSQAANVIEAMEAQTRLFLIDEDTCATNFMVRDDLMQRVVHRDQEPITPFIERGAPDLPGTGHLLGRCGGKLRLLFPRGRHDLADEPVQTCGHHRTCQTGSQSLPPHLRGCAKSRAAEERPLPPPVLRFPQKRPDQNKDHGQGRFLHQQRDCGPALCGTAGGQ